MPRRKRYGSRPPLFPGIELFLALPAANKIFDSFPKSLQEVLEATMWLRIYQDESQIDADLEAAKRLVRARLVPKDSLPKLESVESHRKFIRKFAKIVSRNKWKYNSKRKAYELKGKDGRPKDLLTVCVHQILKRIGGASKPVGELKKNIAIVLRPYFSEATILERNGTVENAIKSFRKEISAKKHS